MSTRVHGMLHATRLRLADGRGHGARGRVSEDDAARLRAPLRLPHQQAAAAADPARCPVPLFAGWRLLDSSGEADAVPDFSVLAGTGGEPARVEENGALLSRAGERAPGAD